MLHYNETCAHLKKIDLLGEEGTSITQWSVYLVQNNYFMDNDVNLILHNFVYFICKR